MSNEIIYSVCGMCPVRCPIEVTVDDGACRFIQGNRRIENIRGALCPRGAAGIAMLKDDERPQFPMARQGARGEGRFRRLSWEEAFDLAAEKIAAARADHGGRGILWADTGGPFSDLRQAFARGLGTPNYFTEESIHAVNTQHAALSLFGFGSDQLAADMRHARHTVLQGRNLFETVDIPQVNDLLDGMGNGGRLTVIDIRATVTAAKADRFLLIRPGSDYALNLAVIQTLLSRKLFDTAAANRWIAGLDELERLASACTPEFAERQTGIRASEIVALAEELAKAAPRVVWLPARRTSRYADSFYVCRTAYIINALLGSVGAKGGLPLSVRPEDSGRHGLARFTDGYPEPGEQRADGVGWKYAAFEGGPGMLHEALAARNGSRPYAPKALLTYQQDPLSQLPDPAGIGKAIADMDFVMCITSAWSETAWAADLVLPLSTYLERESPLGQRNGVRPCFTMRRRCCAPRFDTRADWEIIGGLAVRLGMKELCFENAEQMWNRQLSGTGVNLRDFEAKGVVELIGQPDYGKLREGFRFPTESGRIEIVSFKWRKQGLPSLAPYAPKSAPAAGTFRLTFGGCAFHSGGHTVNNPLLHRQMPENVLWMNRAAAGGLGIADGDTVTIANGERTGRIKVRLDPHIHPEAVFLVEGFGRSLPVESRARGRGLAHNALMAAGPGMVSDAAGGGPAMQENFVTIGKV